jgi:uroporphyrinogen-III synthase
VNAGPLVYLTGEVLAADLAGELRHLGFHVLEPVVYAMREVDHLSPGFVDRFRRGDVEGVVLLSPRTAQIWVRLLRDQAIASQALLVRHFCLSNAVARQLAPLGRVPVSVAAEPNLQQVLALTAADGPQFD